jgi:hypothetical protein
MKYNTEFNLRLIPHGAPQISYSIDGIIANNQLELSVPMDLHFNLDLEEGLHKLVIDFYNKTNDNPDMAVEIKYVEFEGMRLDRFKWSSKYFPTYPEPWASEQTIALPEYHSSATYLGWNGRWELYFETPIFTWIHKLENLGWIYT